MIVVKYGAGNRVRVMAVIPGEITPSQFWDEAFPDGTEVSAGWIKQPDGSFQPPETVIARNVTRRGFARLFTAAERIAIRAASEASPELADMYEMMTLDETVNLDHPDVAAGMAALVTAGLLTQPRATAILAGTPPA